MKKILIIPIIFFVAALTLSFANASDVLCRSEKQGYCASLAAGQMAEQKHKEDIGRSREFAAALPFPGLEFLNGITFESSIGDTLSAIYVYGISLVGISALIMFVYGGLIYMTAGDNFGRVNKAKEVMSNAVSGVVIALASWLLLYVINPDLTFKLQLQSLNPLPSTSLPPPTSPATPTPMPTAPPGYNQSSYF